jgi:TolA-binding protein
VGALVLLAALPGCASLPQMHWPWKHEETAKEGVDRPKDSFVMRGNGLERAPEIWHPRQQDLADARKLLEDKRLVDAEKAFHSIAADTKCPEQFREEALFFEAECLRLQKKYRMAEETYSQLFKDYPSTQFTERGDRGLFEIALYWLQETREQMKAYEDQREGKRWFVAPLMLMHFSEDKPLFDCEGRATRVLEGIQMREKIMHTALGEQALLYLGTLRFYREDYFEADRYFTDLFQGYPNSKHADKAVKMSVLCKQLCTGGTIYDLRTIEEARRLIHTAQTAYPEFAKDTEWIQKQLVGLNLQQADRDWRIGEHYRWTGHPGSAYFYYELVRRCYPNTEYAAKAEKRIQELEQRHPEAMRPSQAGAPPSGAALGGPTAGDPAPPRMLPPSLSPRP